MAKELPYFKFEPGQWESGNIQLCNHEAKGVFTDVCSMYWQRLGDLPYKLALQKICNGNATALESLIKEEIIKVVEGSICIDFLNEQLSEFETTSKVNSQNARIGWQKRKNNAIPKRTHSDPNAIRGEETREDESERIQSFTLGTGKNFFVVKKKLISDKSYRIQGTDGMKQYFEMNQSSIAFPDMADKFMRDKNTKTYNEWQHVWNDFNAFVEKQFK